jgi:hypothetical protein
VSLRLTRLIIGSICIAALPSDVFASGSSTPPIRTSFSAQAQCGFGDAELRYCNSWNPQSGHSASVQSLHYGSSTTARPNFERTVTAIQQKFLSAQQRIDRVSASCYEADAVIFNVFVSTLAKDVGGRHAWLAGPTIHIRVSAEDVSLSSSSGG